MRRRKDRMPPPPAEGVTGAHHSSGSVLWQQGDRAAPVKVVSGVISYRRANCSLGILGPGQIALPSPGRPADPLARTDLIAVSDCLVNSVDPALVDDEAAVVSLNQVLQAGERLGNLPLSQRIAVMLLEISSLTQYPVIFCRQDTLAMLVAARRETVSTILSDWREEDWIDTRYRRILIRSPEQLELIAQHGMRDSDAG